MMKIYGRTTSFNVQKVLWLLEELGMDYEHIELGGCFGGLETADFSALNPIQKVPVLVDNNKTIWESHSILRYLVTHYGGSEWYSNNPYERSLYERWMDWSQTSFQPAFMGVFWGYYRTLESKRNVVEVEKNRQKCIACLDVLNSQLNESNYLVGSFITLADVCVGAILYRLTSQKLEDDNLSIELPNNVARWYEELKNRSGYQKWIMSDFSELKGREHY